MARDGLPHGEAIVQASRELAEVYPDPPPAVEGVALDKRARAIMKKTGEPYAVALSRASREVAPEHMNL